MVSVVVFVVLWCQQQAAVDADLRAVVETRQHACPSLSTLQPGMLLSCLVQAVGCGQMLRIMYAVLQTCRSFRILELGMLVKGGMVSRHKGVTGKVLCMYYGHQHVVVLKSAVVSV